MVMLDFPDLRQSKNYDCGAVVTQGLLDYYGIDMREDKIMKFAGTSRKGTPIKGIVKTLKKYKLNPIVKRLTIYQVKRFISKGHPVILVLQAWTNRKKINWEKDWSDGHYVVAIGYDKKKMYFDDPSSVLKTYLSFKELEKRWHDIDSKTKGKKYVHLGIVAYGKKRKFSGKKAVHMD